MSYITVVPAYGKDYRSQAAVKKAWKDGDDFQICDIGSSCDGRYINNADAEQDLKGATINVRYDGNKKVLPIKIK